MVGVQRFTALRCIKFVIRFFVGRRSIKKSVEQSKHVKEQLDDMDDYRPYFTYWATFVQILIMFIALLCYGFGPVGFTFKDQRGFVSAITTFCF